MGVCKHSSVGFVQIVWKEWNVYSNYSLGSKEEENEEEDKKKIIHVRNQKTRSNVKRGHSRYYRSGRLAKERKKNLPHTIYCVAMCSRYNSSLRNLHSGCWASSLLSAFSHFGISSIAISLLVKEVEGKIARMLLFTYPEKKEKTVCQPIVFLVVLSCSYRLYE